MARMKLRANFRSRMKTRREETGRWRRSEIKNTEKGALTRRRVKNEEKNSDDLKLEEGEAVNVSTKT